MIKSGKGLRSMKVFQNKKLVIAVGIALFVIAAIVISVARAGVLVETAAADQGEVNRVLKEKGTVEAVSSVTIVAKAFGEISGLAVAEGDTVASGDLLAAGIGTGAAYDIKSRQAQLAGLQLEYNAARKQADINRSLYEAGAISYRDYEASESVAKQLAAQLDALRYAIQGETEASGAGGIKATAAGVVTGVFVQEGEAVSAGTPLFEISDLSDIYVQTDLIADDADLVREGNAVRVYNKNTGLDHADAFVKKVHLKAQNKMSDLGVNQKRVTVEIAFGSPAAVRLGSDVNVEITVKQKENVLRVPETAVFEKEGKNYVFTVKGGKAVLREITIGLEGEDFMEIISGLEQGETVILSPGDDVSDGVRVKAKQ